jgi:hypothetical protein
MKKYFSFDNEPITGWSFFLRNLLGMLGLIVFVLPGLWIWAANGYKRAGAFKWSSEMRIVSAIAVVLAQVSNILSRDPSYVNSPMNIFDYIAIPCGILTFILLVKNGNKLLKEAPNDSDDSTEVNFKNNI